MECRSDLDNCGGSWQLPGAPLTMKTTRLIDCVKCLICDFLAQKIPANLFAIVLYVCNFLLLLSVYVKTFNLDRVY